MTLNHEQYKKISGRFPKQHKPTKIRNLDVRNAALYLVENRPLAKLSKAMEIADASD